MRTILIVATGTVLIMIYVAAPLIHMYATLVSR
jgi:hypothetical protein